MSCGQITLTIESDIQHVFLLGWTVNQIAFKLLGDRVEAYKVEVSVVEAVNNAIIHAYGRESGQSIEVCIMVEEEALILEIRYGGQKMSRGSTFKPEYDPKESKNLPEGGMGLYIMGEFMDEIEYRHEGEMNVLCMRKYLPRRRSPLPF